MHKRIAILHYASPPTVGGVESTIRAHALAFLDLGYAVRIVTGSGTSFDPRMELHHNPLFGSNHPDVLAAKTALDSGTVPTGFEALVQRQAQALREALHGCDVCIVHNAHTLNKNLALTSALSRLHTPRLIAWAHDLAWTNPQYLPELYPGDPWELLKRPWQNTTYVTVSAPRRDELAALFAVPPETITVVPPGVDPAEFFRWTAATRRIEATLNLLDAYALLLLPARLTRRKNIALALRVLAALRDLSNQDIRLLVTGPPGPHNPSNPGYFGELLALRHDLALENCAHFLYELDQLIPDDPTMADLYGLADALLFPSTQEGFGIPVLEAGLVRIPVFCSDIPAFRQTGAQDVTYFDPLRSPPDVIAAQILAVLRQESAFRLRQRVRHHYRWSAIIRSQIIPLLEVP